MAESMKQEQALLRALGTYHLGKKRFGALSKGGLRGECIITKSGVTLLHELARLRQSMSDADFKKRGGFFVRLFNKWIRPLTLSFADIDAYSYESGVRGSTGAIPSSQ